MELSPRLRAVAQFIPQGARLADVGTDHAYLPVWLLQRGQIAYAVASDLREGPLERARATAARYGMSEQIRFCLGDGLVRIMPDEVDTIVIAGMGGETISAILAAAPWLKAGNHRLILQPMSAQEDLRAWLAGNGYRIVQESLSREGETLYVALCVLPGEMVLSVTECCVGQQKEGMAAPLREAYLNGWIAKTERAAAGLRKSKRPEDQGRLAEREALLRGLYEMREEWQAWQR
ncbi:MAG: class I SAM-dependent methyltransferase [Oscillospiraceae bacterium]|nr:class I SAM-dependent methyltransferase [Oscillospiraceae bacterium]